MSVDHASKMFLLSTTGLLTSATTKNIMISYYLRGSIRIHFIYMLGKRAQALTFLELKHAVRIHPNSWGEFGHSLIKY